MFLLKKILFKFMELGLGLRTCFSLDTKDPIFVNFKLSPEEADNVQKGLPPGFQLRTLKFFEHDSSPEYWISYNLYELKYPKKELENIRKVRCEINTFVQDSAGRKGVFVFSGSPYVSKEEKASPIGMICDFAERLVIGIYGCGKLIPLTYAPSETDLRIELNEGGNVMSLQLPLPKATLKADERLSDDYGAFNDISFFNDGKTHDFVHVNGAFGAARFHALDEAGLRSATIESRFFRRAPDKIYFHRGEISYLVNAMNRGRP